MAILQSKMAWLDSSIPQADSFGYQRVQCATHPNQKTSLCKTTHLTEVMFFCDSSDQNTCSEMFQGKTVP